MLDACVISNLVLNLFALITVIFPLFSASMNQLCMILSNFAVNVRSLLMECWPRSLTVYCFGLLCHLLDKHHSIYNGNFWILRKNWWWKNCHCRWNGSLPSIGQAPFHLQWQFLDSQKELMMFLVPNAFGLILKLVHFYLFHSLSSGFQGRVGAFIY